MKEAECEEMMKFLKYNMEIFAWMPYKCQELTPSSSATNSMCTKGQSLSYRSPKGRPSSTLRPLMKWTVSYKREQFKRYTTPLAMCFDMGKTPFISPKGRYCYKVMPFGLENTGATYQCMVYLMFGKLIGNVWFV